MKIYTGTGDKGRTSLFSGERVLKSDLRMDACGGMDELNAFTGSIKAAWEITDPDLDRDIDQIQSWLLEAGAWLATTPDSPLTGSLNPFTDSPARHLESSMDRLSEQLPEIRQFILPQGHRSAAFAHMARTVCRRVERVVLSLCRQENPEQSVTEPMKNILVFLNRLSDYFFILARYLNHRHKVKETLWKHP
ncbi:cob(I)yrinic acid a,c-diamide adenosyltransferase [Desulfotignum balticum]|jgi:cob(I)alamin adenosyltransferase|uniref:cob(I)yrinic acid a,c-diamide adenosyltransferase n=1 Tax=Desulfotignum balticum TaxID=115781 RepID=UPI0004081728|nr:cob(I)yrinic acid a,c-diamide adenosyltransferase [Desulfotignum balticum]